MSIYLGPKYQCKFYENLCLLNRSAVMVALVTSIQEIHCISKKTSHHMFRLYYKELVKNWNWFRQSIGVQDYEEISHQKIRNSPISRDCYLKQKRGRTRGEGRFFRHSVEVITGDGSSLKCTGNLPTPKGPVAMSSMGSTGESRNIQRGQRSPQEAEANC